MIKQNAYFIVWNSTKKNFNKIYNDIGSKTVIKQKSIVKIKKYFDLICDLYLFNNQKELGIYKATKMCDNSKYEVMILTIQFQAEAKDDYTLVKQLKKEIRNIYKFTTENYFHDNIIHGTDSVEEYNYVKNIVNTISNYQ